MLRLLSRPLTVSKLRTNQFSSFTRNMKVLAILYRGEEAARQEPRLLGTVENELGLRQWLESQGHEFIVSDSKEGPDSVFQKNLADAEVLITTPFHPGYLTRDLIEKAKNLKICITAGVGSDHVDLNAAVDHKIQVLEVSGSNVVSVAEHVIMSILLLVRNFIPAHEMIERGDWQVSDVARNAFDLEGKVRKLENASLASLTQIIRSLVPLELVVSDIVFFNDWYLSIARNSSTMIMRHCPNVCSVGYHPSSSVIHPTLEAGKAVNARRVEDLKDLVSQCDVVTVNCPLHEGTRGLVNADLLKHFKKGSWLVNTARGAICNKEDVAAALASGQLAGYSGDVWDVQPAPVDHVWRQMKNPLGGGNGMVPHYSGTTLDAQARYAKGTRSILENYLSDKPQEPQNIIIGLGKYETKAYGQR
ncbi:hypothetical protein NLI96_g10149 [Meripilus lineatus]|uniref:Formate dehydrogenase n=1 Tax=Meripilus lineatus TaxID=2056292 RepID=A0AAD5Y9J9_9APHY|nr:hypothetical protein NLI96_g10149 [Physisporinus lineatus]